jgi:hypothetical protein
VLKLSSVFLFSWQPAASELQLSVVEKRGDLVPLRQKGQKASRRPTRSDTASQPANQGNAKARDAAAAPGMIRRRYSA